MYVYVRIQTIRQPHTMCLLIQRVWPQTYIHTDRHAYIQHRMHVCSYAPDGIRHLVGKRGCVYMRYPSRHQQGQKQGCFNKHSLKRWLWKGSGNGYGAFPAKCVHDPQTQQNKVLAQSTPLLPSGAPTWGSASGGTVKPIKSAKLQGIPVPAANVSWWPEQLPSKGPQAIGPPRSLPTGFQRCA